MSGNEPDNRKHKQILELPKDIPGRLACVLIGVFFGGIGTWSLIALVVLGRGLDAYIIYELSLLAAALGWTIFIWGLAVPKWLERVISRLTAKIVLVVAVLFIPFAIEAICRLIRGNV